MATALEILRAMAQRQHFGASPALQDFEPAEADLMRAQTEEGIGTLTRPEEVSRVGDTPWSLGGGGSAVRGTTVTGGGSSVLSREGLKDTAMQKAKQMLRIKDIDQSQAMERITTPVALRGQYDIAASEAQGRAMGDRLRFTQDAQNQRAEANQAAIMERLNQQQEFTAGQNEANRAARTDGRAVPVGLATAVQKAQSAYNSPVSKLGRLVGFGGGADDYKTALTSLLRSQGSLDTMLQTAQEYSSVEAAIADAQRQGAPLDPNEVAFLRLLMEQ